MGSQAAADPCSQMQIGRAPPHEASWQQHHAQSGVAEGSLVKRAAAQRLRQRRLEARDAGAAAQQLHRRQVPGRLRVALQQLRHRRRRPHKEVARQRLELLPVRGLWGQSVTIETATFNHTVYLWLCTPQVKTGWTPHSPGHQTVWHYATTKSTSVKHVMRIRYKAYMWHDTTVTLQCVPHDAGAEVHAVVQLLHRQRRLRVGAQHLLHPLCLRDGGTPPCNHICPVHSLHKHLLSANSSKARLKCLCAGPHCTCFRSFATAFG